MRFNALEEYGRNARLMLQKAAGYYNGRDIAAEAVGGFSDIIELSSIDDSDVVWMHEYASSDDYSSVSEELESFLDCNKLHDKKVFDAWKDHLLLHFQCLPKLVIQMLSELSSEDFESVPEPSRNYKDMRELARDMVAVVMDKMDGLETLIGEVSSRYGLTGMPHLSLQSISCLLEQQPETKKKGTGRPSYSGSAFHRYVSNGYDVEEVRAELYNAVNGKIGGEAVDIIISAMKDGRLKKTPIPFKVAQEALGVGGSKTSYNNNMNVFRDPYTGEMTV